MVPPFLLLSGFVGFVLESLGLGVRCQKFMPPTEPCRAGRLVWRRHATTCNPTRHQLRATCMALLPLVEMFCKWELQEDCNDLRSLMLRFDSESELETRELGHSLLHMVRDDDADMEFSSHRLNFDVPSNPFDAIRSRLADIDRAFRALQPQVRLPVDFTSNRALAGMPAMAFGMPDCSLLLLCINKTFKGMFNAINVMSHICLYVVCPASNFDVCIQLFF